MAVFLTPDPVDLVGIPRNNDILSQMLIVERRSVLFVGEGDFSFTVAFAALRAFNHREGIHAWSGITSTRYEPAGSEDEQQFVGEKRVQCKPRSNLKEVKLECIASFTDSFLSKLQHDLLFDASQLHITEVDRNRRILASITSLPSDFAWPWLYGIDALAIPKELIHNKKVIWFQCPWIRRCDGVTHALIRDFLLNAAGRIEGGVHVCIGITEHPNYFAEYQLENLTLDRDISEKYVFLGGDDMLVKEVLKFGYRHQTADSSTDIHQYILDYHVTIIFQRYD